MCSEDEMKIEAIYLFKIQSSEIIVNKIHITKWRVEFIIKCVKSIRSNLNSEFIFLNVQGTFIFVDLDVSGEMSINALRRVVRVRPHCELYDDELLDCFANNFAIFDKKLRFYELERLNASNSIVFNPQSGKVYLSLCNRT